MRWKSGFGYKELRRKEEIFWKKEELTYFLTLLYLHVTEFFSAPREQL